MTYGRTPHQELLLVGRRLLSRHYYGDGRWGWRPRDAQDDRAWGDWRIVKQRPKQTTWARAGGALARKTHAVRYALTATHTTGARVFMTVWWCGQYAHSAPRPVNGPQVVCAGCQARLSGVTEVPIGEVVG